MDTSPLSFLRRQYDIAWALTEISLAGLGDEECFWLPSPGAWTVRREPDGSWRADWAETEPDPPPLVSVGWLTWHVDMWWSTAHAHAVGRETTSPEQIVWAGTAAAAVARIERLHADWSAVLDQARDEDLAVAPASSWPFPGGQPFGDVLAWVNLELMKNAAEIGQLRRIRLVGNG
ncbi:DinB family protein [Cryptosporangium aurantiacum]|uniref:DinB superfamily protein n=1 Tax=Cryptosporangium aurantiacum TaxID=134849 RepID=A0A1M7TY78_9ACTN|nr:DinB family protein [Cryptosporangium aurantiacum]SHN75674.1 DinB superfamily protein [Cryptosporangium aurantiacum]